MTRIAGWVLELLLDHVRFLDEHVFGGDTTHTDQGGDA